MPITTPNAVRLDQPISLPFVDWWRQLQSGTAADPLVLDAVVVGSGYGLTALGIETKDFRDGLDAGPTTSPEEAFADELWGGSDEPEIDHRATAARSTIGGHKAPVVAIGARVLKEAKHSVHGIDLNRLELPVEDTGAEASDLLTAPDDVDRAESQGHWFVAHVYERIRGRLAHLVELDPGERHDGRPRTHAEGGRGE